MANNVRKLTVTITTPRGVKVVEEADKVVMRAIDGTLGVLPRHAPLSTVLGDGVLKIVNNGVEKKMAVFGGVAEIINDTVNIFSTIAQSPDEIDTERAESDRLEAEVKLEEARERRMRVMQTRALIRIYVSESDYLEDTPDDEGIESD